MSRALRQQQLSMIHSLEKANRALKEALTKTRINEEGILQLLADCQDTAILMGNTIEAVYGEGTDSVARLEDYCEALYEMTLVISEPISRREKIKTLAGHLKQMRRTISGEIPDRLEAVFLPYKASMWDSLESVWRAAAEDEDCDAYVIPIPYYDKNPDGSFSEMHYEGDDYPDYVPVTHYQDYDFAGRRPDMIFIHNPYDEYNYVTSVDPFFYSKNLKNFTDKLVYIPYFVLGEIDPDNEEALKGIEHFCVVQGVVNSDKVIVQSEAMREAYIKIMTKQTGAHTRKYWEEKILGLGSPKIDKVLSTRKENVQVPEEWLKIIQKEDGSWRKIIFYNTSVNALLKHERKMLEKMRSVFRTFQENRGEAALLWRPHPLIKATIESMRPELWEEYYRLVEDYKAAGWGIYDDSADMDRAVALCDAYYGDSSSLVQLCQEAGKPVMIQNVEIL
ncbi:MAG: hypothetical protein HFH12_10160 [Dorea sp.]|nr:hypothetical protein [Dorea sp.]